MNCLACLFLLLSVPNSTGRNKEDYWVQSMGEVHAKFTGQRGTFAQFGDSITVTMAFWSPLPYSRKNSPPEMETAFQKVNHYMWPECWRDWKGLEFGSEGGKTILWAYENIDGWLKELNPEVALIMFGTNDLHSLELDEYTAKMRLVIQKCLTNGTIVILSTIPPRSGFEEKSALFSEAIREIASEFNLPLIDYYAEILKRRPDDWDGSMEKFRDYQGYDVPTLISRDGVHPGHPEKYRDDYSEEALDHNGFSLRNYITLLKYSQVVEKVLTAVPNQEWFPKAPTLPEPTGQIIRATSVDELFSAVQQVEPGGTILVADGHYMMPRYLEISTDNVTLRGESGQREKVILDGINSRHGELVGISRCSGVTIADLTIQNIKYNGFKINSNTNVQQVTIHNCIIHNIWQRGVKGVKVPEENREMMRPKGCKVQYCLFYNDRPKRFTDDPADTQENFNGDYIGGMDVMCAKDWVISDNVFIGIQGRNRSARGAIFMWNDSQDCIIERNIIIDCDQGIALGNSHRDPECAIHCTRFLVRNNFITRAPENGILADYTKDCKIIHNTVHDPKNRLQRLIRLVHDNDGLMVAHNLLSGPPMRIETDSDIRFCGNVTKDLTGSFVNAQSGNLHLKARIPGVTGAVFRLPDGDRDIDCQLRDDPADVGADEL